MVSPLNTSRIKEKMIISIIVIITIFFTFHLNQITVDNDIHHFYPEHTDSAKDLQAIQEIFKDPQIIDIIVSTSDDSIITAESLFTIQTMTEEIQNLHAIQSVQSLTNIDYLSAFDGGLQAGSLVPSDFSGSKGDIEQIKEHIKSWRELYERVIISHDYHSSQILVTIDERATQKQRQDLSHQLNTIIQKHATDHLTMQMTGIPVISAALQSAMYSNLLHFIPLILVATFACLLLQFRKLKTALLSLLPVSISTLWTLGLMAYQGVPLSIMSSCIPVIIPAVGTAYAIHILSQYQNLLEKEKGIISLQRKKEIIHQTMKREKYPLLFSALTTMVGFLVNVTNPIKPVHIMAQYTTIGIACTLLLSFTFIPAVLSFTSLQGVKTVSKKKQIIVGLKETNQEQGKFEKRYHHIMSHHRNLILFGVICIVLSLFYRIYDTSTPSLLTAFPSSSPLSLGLEEIDTNFTGSTFLYVVVSGEKDGDLTHPEILKSMDNLSLHLTNTYPEIGKIISVNDFIKKMNQVFHTPSETLSTDTEDVVAFTEQPDSFFESETTQQEQPHSFFENQESPAKKSVTTLPKDFSAFQGTHDYYEIPYDIAKYPVESEEGLQNLISQYLLLYSGSLTQFINEPLLPSVAKMTVALTTHDTKKIATIIEDTTTFVKDNFPPGYQVTVSGQAVVDHAVINSITQSIQKGLLVTILSILLLFTVYFRSAVADFIGMIPVLVSLLFTFLFFGSSGLVLNLLMGSITIGLAIDYSIHFMMAYQIHDQQTHDEEKASVLTFASIGKASLFSVLTASVGFFVCIASKLIIFRSIGILIGLSLITSALASFIILPSLFKRYHPKFLTNESHRAREQNQENRKEEANIT